MIQKCSATTTEILNTQDNLAKCSLTRYGVLWYANTHVKKAVDNDRKELDQRLGRCVPSELLDSLCQHTISSSCKPSDGLQVGLEVTDRFAGLGCSWGGVVLMDCYHKTPSILVLSIAKEEVEPGDNLEQTIKWEKINFYHEASIITRCTPMDLYSSSCPGDWAFSNITRQLLWNDKRWFANQLAGC